MWTDDLDFAESCDFYRSLLNLDSIDSIGAYAATNTFVYVKAPIVGWKKGRIETPRERELETLVDGIVLSPFWS